MAHITFIHGIANKPDENTLEKLWKSALARDNPKPDVFSPPNDGLDLENYDVTSKMVYWADVLYKEPDNDVSGYGYESGAKETILEGVSRDVSYAHMSGPPFDIDTLHLEERLVVEDMAMQLGMDRKLPDDYLPSDKELRRAMRGKYQLERIPLPWFVKKQVMKMLLRDVHHYLFNADSCPRGDCSYKVRDELQSKLLNALKEGAQKQGPHILVSHSMGTIVSYDVLRNCPDCPPIDHFITLGSPLGLDEVQDKLKHPGLKDVDFPSEKLRGEWVNFFDHLDPVAGFDPFFANDYLKAGQEIVKDVNEQNWGDWRHSIQKYLSGTKFRKEMRRLLNV